MEMCPYCGEDVPDDSQSCWKCGTELSGDGGDDAPLDDEPSIEQRDRTSDEAPSGECPHCGAIIGLKALRCNDCGRVVRKAQTARNWIPAVYASFGIVLLGLLVGLVYSYVINAKGAPDPGRDAPLKISYEKLKQIYIDPPDSPRIQSLWEERHRGKFVEWDMVVMEVDEEAGVVTWAGSRTADGTEAEVTLKRPEQIEELSLKTGKAFTFSAKLIDWEDETFNLELGIVLEDE